METIAQCNYNRTLIQLISDTARMALLHSGAVALHCTGKAYRDAKERAVQYCLHYSPIRPSSVSGCIEQLHYRFAFIADR